MKFRVLILFQNVSYVCIMRFNLPKGKGYYGERTNDITVQKKINQKKTGTVVISLWIPCLQFHVSVFETSDSRREEKREENAHMTIPHLCLSVFVSG